MLVSRIATLGVLDEVAIYDHALCPERIKAHYDFGVLGPP